MSPGIIILVVILITIAVVVSISVSVFVYNKKYRDFVLNHCESIKQLQLINAKYNFNIVPNMDMTNTYDNENMYGDISCMDYLIYQLAYNYRKVESCLDATYANQSLFREYKKEFKESVVPLTKHYDVNELPRNINKLEKVEKNELKKMLKNPITDFSITVKLVLTQINGVYRHSKHDVFYSDKLEKLIEDVKDKRGSYYERQYIWNAICRVERGKVTNRMRFFIYERDGYRCQICGRSTNDLEVDHIIPISKGGKSTPDNLQTLCHRCNYRKGSSIY